MLYCTKLYLALLHSTLYCTALEALAGSADTHLEYATKPCICPVVTVTVISGNTAVPAVPRP